MKREWESAIGDWQMTTVLVTRLEPWVDDIVPADSAFASLHFRKAQLQLAPRWSTKGRHREFGRIL